MAHDHHLLEKILRDNHYSVTPQRRLLFTLLCNKPPQTMRELITGADGALDRVSIYRIIELYEKLGIVHRIAIGWKYKLELSEVFLKHHHHLSCHGCGKVVAIKDDRVIEEAIEQLSATYGFVLTAHQIELQGICPACSRQTDKNSLP